MRNLFCFNRIRSPCQNKPERSEYTVYYLNQIPLCELCAVRGTLRANTQLYIAFANSASLREKPEQSEHKAFTKIKYSLCELCAFARKPLSKANTQHLTKVNNSSANSASLREKSDQSEHTATNTALRTLRLREKKLNTANTQQQNTALRTLRLREKNLSTANTQQTRYRDPRIQHFFLALDS